MIREASNPNNPTAERIPTIPVQQVQLNIIELKITLGGNPEAKLKTSVVASNIEKVHKLIKLMEMIF